MWCSLRVTTLGVLHCLGMRQWLWGSVVVSSSSVLLMGHRIHGLLSTEGRARWLIRAHGMLLVLTHCVVVALKLLLLKGSRSLAHLRSVLLGGTHRITVRIDSSVPRRFHAWIHPGLLILGARRLIWMTGKLKIEWLLWNRRAWRCRPVCILLLALLLALLLTLLLLLALLLHIR